MDEFASYLSPSPLKSVRYPNVSFNQVPVIISLVVMVAYIFGGAYLFSNWEDNIGFVDGAYFCFITLTTIGFGDIVSICWCHSHWELARTILNISGWLLAFNLFNTKQIPGILS